MTDDTNMQGIPEPEGDVDLIETDYDIGQDNIEGAVGPFGFDIHNPVFLISGLSVVAFVVYALLAPTHAADFFGWLRPALTSTFDWFFLLSANIFVIFCLALIVLPVGRVRLGGADATPDYSYAGWFAMLFCRRHGHRADVLRRARAGLLLRHAVGRRTPSAPSGPSPRMAC